ncbi:MAG TPA: cupin domain-containing protein [Gaiellaceae bacterium]|nr:cupin domain-containing protein [Gaiellaceae bacterium]
MGYVVIDPEELSWDERPYREDEPAPRLTADLTTAANLKESRARLWRYPPHTRGRRHSERVQEEVFVVLSGTVTLLLGEPPQRFDLQPQGVVSLEPGTAVQVRNESDHEAVVLVYGAPPVSGQAEILDDVEL